MLDEPDWDIYYWSIEKRHPPERWAGSKLLEQYVPFYPVRRWLMIGSRNMPRTKER
jgi:hypothetical protein